MLNQGIEHKNRNSIKTEPRSTPIFPRAFEEQRRLSAVR